LLFGAVGLTGAVVLVPAESMERVVTLFGVAGVGGGVASGSVGIALLIRGDLLAGTTAVGSGVAGVCIGAAVLLRSSRLGRVLKVGSGADLG